MRGHEITLDFNSFVFVSTIVGYSRKFIGSYSGRINFFDEERTYIDVSQEREIRVLIY